jgi:hypothetical protein
LSHGSRPVEVDLAALFKRLGVSRKDGHVVFDENAPLAEIRRAITARAASARTVAGSDREER